MFLSFYGLKEQPFGVTPDTRYLCLSNTHREALASLFYGIDAGRGFIAMIAKPGMGKTTLLTHILKKFERSARTAFLFNTQCNSREFLEALASELKFECSASNYVQFLEQFNLNLLREARQNRRCIVVIDEAQNLDNSVLETARLLSNFETSRAKLLQIVLAGQPELADKLGSPGLSQLRQRVSIFCRLEPFTSEETAGYIYHRLHVAGYQGAGLFTPDSLSLIAMHGQGVPRNISNLCFAALSIGCAMGRKMIDADIVREALSDLDVSRLGSRSDPVLSQQREEVRRPQPASADHQSDAYGSQSAITFAKLLRKMAQSETNVCAAPGKAMTAESTSSPGSLGTHSVSNVKEVAAAGVYPFADTAEDSQGVPILGRCRPEPTAVNVFEQPGMMLADRVSSPHESTRPAAVHQMASRFRRKSAKLYLAIAILALVTTSVYHPQASSEVARLTRNAPSQQRPWVRQFSGAGGPPSPKAGPEPRNIGNEPRRLGP